MDKAQLTEKKSSVLEGMLEFMQEVIEDNGEPDYTEGDIEACDVILTNFLENVSKATPGDTKAIKGHIKDTVLALNELNENCEHSLIETDQREGICELIIEATIAAGVGDRSDPTEDWREW